MSKPIKMNPWRLQGLTEPTMTQETQHQAADMWSDEEDPFWEEEAEAITSEFAEMMKAPWLVPKLPPQPWEEVPNEPATFPPWMFALHQMDKQMIGWMKAANAYAKSKHRKKQSTPTTSTQSTNAKTKPKAGSKANEQTYSRATEAEVIANADIKVATSNQPIAQAEQNKVAEKTQPASQDEVKHDKSRGSSSTKAGQAEPATSQPASQLKSDVDAGATSKMQLDDKANDDATAKNADAKVDSNAKPKARKCVKAKDEFEPWRLTQQPSQHR